MLKMDKFSKKKFRKNLSKDNNTTTINPLNKKNQLPKKKQKKELK